MKKGTIIIEAEDIINFIFDVHFPFHRGGLRLGNLRLDESSNLLADYKTFSEEEMAREEKL